MNSLHCNQRPIVKSLFDSVIGDVRSHVGSNARKVFLDTNIRIIPGWTRSSDLKQYRVYQPPEGEEWRLGVLESLLEIKGDNWSVTFNEEEDEEEEFEENDIEMMIYEVCTT